MCFNCSETVEKIRVKLEEYIIDHNLNSLVLGVSGGIDSALVAALASPVCRKKNIPLIGYSITIETNTEEEIERSVKIGKSFCDEFDVVDLTDSFLAMYDKLPVQKTDKTNRGNAKARLRMIFLYDIARTKGGLVLSTDNWTELQLGFWTLHGDVGDLGMIQNLTKTEVYLVSEYLCSVLDESEAKALMACITADATDGLGISKTDLDQIMPDWRDRHSTTRSGYAEVDSRLIEWIERKKKLPNRILTRDPIILRNIGTEGKRLAPYNFPREAITDSSLSF